MEKHGISGTTLMGKAGEKIAETVRDFTLESYDPVIDIVIGKGNNGGDGFAAANVLVQWGYRVQIYCLMAESDITGDASHFYLKCKEKNISMRFDINIPEATSENIIIDALFGTGYRGKIRQEYLPWIEWINQSDALRVSADIPSGVNANTGRIDSKAVKANLTVSMGYGKIGHFLEPGKSYSGDVHSVDIGFPPVSAELDGRQWSVITREWVESKIHPVLPETHKHRQGKILFVAGSTGMTGAAYLATMGALRSGAGLTVTCAPSSLNSIYESKITEGMTISCDDENKGYFSLSNFNQIEEWMEWADVLAIGPGLGKKEETASLVDQLITRSPIPIVLDADGFRILYRNPAILHSVKHPIILTPHYGELSRLIERPAEEIQSNILEAIETFLNSFPCVLVAKNAPTCIATENVGFINSTGNPGLASGGTGDVLTGMIAAFLSQGYSALTSAQLGVYFHGVAADSAAENKGMRSLLASDVLNSLPQVLKSYEN